MSIFNIILTTIKLLLFFLLTLFFSIVILFSPIPQKYCIFLCRIWAWLSLQAFLIKLNVVGDLYKNKHRPIIVISNHFGLAEILAIFCLYNVHFVAKSEMSNWAFFGWSMRRAGQIFINRKRKDSKSHIKEVANSLKKLKNIAFFPEATSSDALMLLPFKSTLFRALNKDNFTIPTTIQPLVITYTKVSGEKITIEQRKKSSWGNVSILRFLFDMASLPTSELTVKALPHINVERPIVARSLVNKLQPDMHIEFANLTKK